MTQNMCPNVIYIPYSSTTTGSKVLRKLNSTDTIQQALYNQSLNCAGLYSKQYDVGKKNEPFYDVLSSQIALCTNFDKYFTYVAVTLTESGTNLNGFHPSQQDPVKCEMKSTEFNGYKSFTRDYFETYFNYSNPTTQHVFIYGPITDLILQILIDKINTTITNNTKLFIHFQGENTLDDKGKEDDMIFGMKSKGNLFCNSFNYQNCMKNAQTFRHFIQSSPHCMSFTVISKYSPDLLTTEIGSEPLDNECPSIYLTFYEHIVQLLNNSFINKDNFYNSLNIINIFQDMVDKDNITSVLFLLINNINLSKCYLYLIGREAFSVTYNEQPFPHHQLMNFSAIPDTIKPQSITEGFENLELNMGKTTECYWPAYKNPELDLVYDENMTKFHYLLSTELFKIALKDSLNGYNCKFNNYYCDCNTLIPNPSSNKQRLCLLSETLFYPYINAYIATINSINPSYFDKFDPKFKTVLNSKSYLSDIELQQLSQKIFS